jgi:hypothetical protein
VNTIAERAARDESIRLAGADYKAKLGRAFSVSLANASQIGQIDPDTVEERAELLAALVLGVWLTVRINNEAAVDLCRTIEREIDSWRRNS